MKKHIRLRLAGHGDISKIATLMAEAERESVNGMYLAGGGKEFVEEHINRQGFCLVAEVTSSHKDEGEFAGFLMVRYPGLNEDNLGRALGFSKEKLQKVAHLEEAVVVKRFRGNHIERQLIAEMNRYIDRISYKYILGVTSPNNIASLKAAKANGFREIAMTDMYHGVERILMLNDC